MSIFFQVSISIAGSHCVLSKNWETYIDARRSRAPGLTNIEVVSSGHVRHYETIRDEEAPARLIELAKRYWK